MSVYLDSSALIKLYVVEENSQAVARLVAKTGESIAISFLHELELKNGLRLKAFRKEAARKTIRAALRHIGRDIDSGVLIRFPLDWNDVFDQADRLSGRHTFTIGSRSLDLLHVASAKVLKAEEFLTFDKRQSMLARKAGLKVLALRNQATI